MVTRRKFVAGGAAAAWTARAYANVRGANERLRVGVIGCGGMASGHMRALANMKAADNVEVVAVCDVWRKRLDKAAAFTGAKPVKHYHDVLNDKDIDYVLIATPEHWHSRMTLDAVDAGKHIYCEKPMTRTVEEARRVAAKLRGSQIKMQVGVQSTSDDSYAVASRFVKEGALGKVVLAQIDYSRNYKEDFWSNPQDADARPGEDLDWQAWLGPAPKRPFDPDRFFSWRRYWDYSGGIASDLFVHRVTRIIKSLDLTFPEYGTAAGGKFHWKDSAAEIPDTINILLDYPQGLTVQLISSMANDTRVSHMLRGNKATLEFTRTGFTITPQKLFENESRELTHQKTGAEDITLHHRNLHNAIRKGEPLNCDVMLGYYGVAAAEIGNQSYRRRKYMKWDFKRERIIPA